MSVDDAIQKALGDLYDNEHVVNFHKRVDTLPAWLGNSLKVMMGVGDMRFEYTPTGEQVNGRLGVEKFPEFDVYVCLPEIWEGSPLRENLEYVINHGFQKKVICYLNIRNPDQVAQFTSLFEDRISFIDGYQNHIPHFGIQSIEKLLHKDGIAQEVFEAYDRFLTNSSEYLTKLKDFFKTKVRTKAITPAEALDGYGEITDVFGGNGGWVDVDPFSKNINEQNEIMHFMTWTWRKLYEMSRESKKISISKELYKQLHEIFLFYKDRQPPVDLPAEELEKMGWRVYPHFNSTCKIFTYCIKCFLLGFLLPPQLVGEIAYVVNPVDSRVRPLLVLKKIGLVAEGGYRKKGKKSRRASKRSKVRKTRRS